MSEIEGNNDSRQINTLADIAELLRKQGQNPPQYWQYPQGAIAVRLGKLNEDIVNGLVIASIQYGIRQNLNEKNLQKKNLEKLSAEVTKKINEYAFAPEIQEGIQRRLDELLDELKDLPETEIAKKLFNVGRFAFPGGAAAAEIYFSSHYWLPIIVFNITFGLYINYLYRKTSEVAENEKNTLEFYRNATPGKPIQQALELLERIGQTQKELAKLTESDPTSAVQNLELQIDLCVEMLKKISNNEEPSIEITVEGEKQHLHWENIKEKEAMMRQAIDMQKQQD